VFRGFASAKIHLFFIPPTFFQKKINLFFYSFFNIINLPL
jgi:hypothetical protein